MKPLTVYISASEQAAYNLALEEHLLLNSTEDVLLFYINYDAVVLGKHQNPYKELNLQYCIDQHIDIIRRLSGGGTVYHDTNNVNFSFIRNKDADFVNFREHIEPISAALKQLGIDNVISPRNDLFIADKKFSGNAEHVNNTKKRILHHGTLLYGSNLEKLRSALVPPGFSIDTHAVNSVRSKVTTIRDYINASSCIDFLNQLISALHDHLNISSVGELSTENIPAIEKLVLEKYTRWDWNFGHSPQFCYTNKYNDRITIRKGVFIKIESEEISEDEIETYIGLPFNKEALKAVLTSEHDSLTERLCIH